MNIFICMCLQRKLIQELHAKIIICALFVKWVKPYVNSGIVYTFQGNWPHYNKPATMYNYNNFVVQQSKSQLIFAINNKNIQTCTYSVIHTTRVFKKEFYGCNKCAIDQCLYLNAFVFCFWSLNMLYIP